MNENENEVLETTEETQDQGDAFMEGWEEDATDTTGSDDQAETETQDQEPPDTTGETQAQEEPAADTAQRETDPGADETEPASEELPTQTWEVNHLGQRTTMRAQDITSELLQKGLDYDRVREQYDRSKPVMSLITTLANQAGVSVEDYTRMVRTQAKQAEGMDADGAKRAVELEDREAAVAAREEAGQESARRQAETQAEIRRGIAEFAKAFPEIYDQARKNPEVIPDSVWAAVNEGLSLTAAYARYAVDQAGNAAKEAQGQVRTAQQNQKNAQRSTGSMRSAGSDTKGKDPFLQGWEE